MNNKILCCLCFVLFCLSIVCSAQKDLHGKVIEINDGKTVGIGNIKVSIKDFKYDITDQQGAFELPIPIDMDPLKLNLENTNRQLISPFSGLVYLPIPDKVELIVCAQENKRLLEEVNKLNNKVKSFQTKYQLSEKKAALTYKEMMDTIVFYEQRIQSLDEQKKQLETQHQAEIQKYKTEIEQLRAEVEKMKQVEASLMQQLLEVKDEYFQKKQTYLQAITAELRSYLDVLQNLQAMVNPERIPQYFAYNDAATRKLSDKIDAYNQARALILKNQDAHLNAAKHYWKDPSVSNQLQMTYQYLLENMHDKTVYPLDSSLVDILKKYTIRELGSQQAKKKAVKAANESYPKWTTTIPVLEEKITTTIQFLKQYF